MAQFESWYSVNLNSPPQVQTIHGNVFTQDNMANLIGVKVFDGAEPVNLTGTVMGYAIKADGETVEFTGSIGTAQDYGTNAAYIELPQICYGVPGRIQIVIRLISGSTKTTLLGVTGYVTRTRTDKIVVPEGVVPDLEELLAQIDAMEQGTAAANQAASAANTAAANANAKAALADQKATLADQKATAANTAATAANTAAGTANTAAQNADQKATLADQKAAAADTAAVAAIAAKEAAELATDDAQDATDAANTAAQQALLVDNDGLFYVYVEEE